MFHDPLWLSLLVTCSIRTNNTLVVTSDKPPFHFIWLYLCLFGLSQRVLIDICNLSDTFRWIGYFRTAFGRLARISSYEYLGCLRFVRWQESAWQGNQPRHRIHIFSLFQGMVIFHEIFWKEGALDLNHLKYELNYLSGILIFTDYPRRRTRKRGAFLLSNRLTNYAISGRPYDGGGEKTNSNGQYNRENILKNC